MKISRFSLLLFLLLVFEDYVHTYITKSRGYHHPSKRIQIPHPSSKNANLYVDGKSYRRQEVIHALNDDSTKTTDDEDDIESLGKSIDSTGAVMKETIPKKHTEPTNEKGTIKGTTKDIIAKIKEIQDKIFKRTGSKDLESKLKQMSDIFPVAKQPITNVNTALLHNSTTNIDGTIKVTDGSKRADRRKIIPEEVVDKILEKFQQLRQEAKHMALLETKHDAEKESSSGKEHSAPVKDENPVKPSNPYSSIGPAKENAELKNRTQHNTDVRPVGIDAQTDMLSQSPPETTVSDPKNNNNIEIPIGNAMNNQIPIQNMGQMLPNQANNQPNQPNSPNQMPVMFIKNGQMLVPVFGGNNNNGQQSQQQPGGSQMSITGTGMAQLNTNPGVAMPNSPNNVVPITSPQQLMAAFMGAMPNAFRNQGNQNPMQMMNMNGMQGFADGPNGPSATPYIPAHSQVEEPSSRCGIPGSDCPTPTQNVQSYQPQQQFIQQSDNMPTMGNSPSTVDLIRNILNAPGFPQLAARLMNEPRRYQDEGRDSETGESRGFNNVLPSLPMRGYNQPPSEEEQMNAGRAQFNLQAPFNQAPRDDPGSVFSQPTNPQGPLMGNPHEDARFIDREDDRREQDERDSQLFNSRNVAMNDISDPDPSFQQRAPDQLLDFARGRSEQQERQETSMPYGDNAAPMLPTRMSIQRGGTERTLLSGVDPGSLLDKLHGAQLKGGLLGAGDPNLFGGSKPTESADNMQAPAPQSFGGTPDDLLEMLRNQNDKVFSKTFADNDARRMNNERRHQFTDGLDPSFADDIQDTPFGNQMMDVQNKNVAEDNNMQGSFVARHKLPRRKNDDISVLNDNFVQYKHGRMSMDSAGIVNSFFRDPQYYRNSISHPPGGVTNKNVTLLKKSKTHTEKGVVRASISKTLPDDNIELEVNGKKINDKQTLRSKIVNGKLVQPNAGKTISSKGPVQIELSHGENKRKIINIVTKSKYNVTDERKREFIPRRVKLVDD